MQELFHSLQHEATRAYVDVNHRHRHKTFSDYTHLDDRNDQTERCSKCVVLKFCLFNFALVGQLTDKHEKISEFFGGLFLGGIFVCYS